MYTGCVISSTLLFLIAPLVYGFGFVYVVLSASASAFLIFLSVVLWYKHIHRSVAARPKLAVLLLLLTSVMVITCISLRLLYVIPSLILQLTLALTSVVERVKDVGRLLRDLASRVLRGRKGSRNVVWRNVPRELQVFLYIDLFTAMLFIPSVVIGSYLLFVGSDMLVSSVGLTLMVYGLAGVFYHVVSLLKPPIEVKVRILKKKWYTAFLVKHPGIYRFAEKYTDYIKKLLVQAGVFQGPLVYASRYFVPALLILVSLGPLGAVAPIMLGPIGFVVLGIALAIPLVLILTPIAYLSSRRGDRKRRVEDELPWFTLYASIMQSAGLSLYESLKRLIGKNILPAIETEATIVERNVKLLGMDQVSAIEALARHNPSRRFSEFLYSYTTILRTGGDLVSYLESRVREYLELLKFRLRRYAERSVDLGEILISMFFILTSIVVSLTLVAGDIALMAIRMYNYLAIPIITITLYSVINAVQPKLYNRYLVNHALPAITTPMATFVAIVLGWEPWLIIASFVIGLAGGYGVQYYMQQRLVSAEERALQDFLRDVAEYRKIGLPVSRAILAISEKRRYNRYFDEIVSYIAMQIRMHRRLNEIVIPTGSWLVRIIFFILGEIEATGGGTIKVLEELVNFVQEYNIARSEARGMLRLYEFLAYITPVMLVLTVSLVTGLSTNFLTGLSIESGPSLPQLFSAGNEVNLDLFNEIKTSTLLASLSLAVLTSKTIDYTVRNTVRAIVIVILTIIAFNVLQPIAEEIIKSLV